MEQKNISFGYGIRRNPTIASDGELSECVNLIPENGELVNIRPAKKIGMVLDGGDFLVYIHKTADYTHYIARNGDSICYYSGESRTLIAKVGELKAVTSIGNTVVLSTDEGMKYAVWRGGKYNVLDKKPDLDIQFGLSGKFVTMTKTKQIVVEKAEGKNTSVISIYSNLVEVFETKTSSFHFTEDDRLNVPLVKGKTYKFTRRGSEHKWYLWGYYQDGSEVKCFKIDRFRASEELIHTMEHDVIGIKVSYDSYAEEIPSQLRSVEVSIYDSLEDNVSGYQIKNDASNFDGVIGIADEFLNYYRTTEKKFIEPFFIRYGFKLYDGTVTMQSVPIFMQPNTGCSPITFIPEKFGTANEQTVSISVGANVCDVLYKIANDIDLNGWEDIITGVSIAVSSPIYKYKMGEKYDEMKNQLPFKPFVKASIIENRTHAKVEVPTASTKDIWWSHMIPHDSYDLLLAAINTDYSLAKDYNFVSLPSYTDEEFEKSLAEASLFYQVAEIKFNDISKGDDFKKLDIESFTALETKPLMNDDFNSHNILTPESLLTYNSRVCAANVSEELYKGFPVPLMTQYEEESVEKLFSTSRYYAEIKINSGGNTYTVSEDFTSYDSYSDLKWFYYPNAEAVSATIFGLVWSPRTGSYSDYYIATIDLKKHNYLNGAYYYSESGMPFEYFGSIADTDIPDRFNSKAATARYGNRLYQSNVYNPFSFDVSRICSVGMESIIGMSTVTKALSSGTEFGSSPLICFCSDGIWPVFVSGQGEFVSAKPLTRDVCSNARSITQLDDSVAFVTRQGLKMTDGSERGTVLISGKMDGSKVPESVFGIVPEEYEDMLVKDTESFTQMLQTCTMAFDYPHQLLHIYPSVLGKQYVYSLKSGEFASFSGEGAVVAATVPGYPLTTVQLPDGNLCVYDFLEDDGAVRIGAVFTRPCALDNPLALKCVADVRISYSKSSVRSTCRMCIQVSNDRHKWYNLHSLRSHAFKWYRFAIFTRLSDEDSLEGLSVMFENRRTGKIR